MTSLQDALRELAKEREALELECDLLANAEEALHNSPEYGFWLIQKGAKDLAGQDVKEAYAQRCLSTKTGRTTFGDRMTAIATMHKTYGKNERHWCWDCRQLLNYPQGTCTCEMHPHRPLWQRDWCACEMWKSINKQAAR